MQGLGGGRGKLDERLVEEAQAGNFVTFYIRESRIDVHSSVMCEQAASE